MATFTLLDKAKPSMKLLFMAKVFAGAFHGRGHTGADSHTPLPPGGKDPNGASGRMQPDLEASFPPEDKPGIHAPKGNFVAVPTPQEPKVSVVPSKVGE